MTSMQKFQLHLTCDEYMFMPTDIPVDIFHYTSPAGYESILFGNPSMTELWASRYDCLNDASEGTVVLERYTDVCNNLLDSSELPNDLYQLIANVKPPRTTIMLRQRGETTVATRPEYVRYVCSFSTNPDSLVMWNYYSKGNKYEGLNVGFFASSLLESIETQLRPYESNVKLWPVVYDREQQESLIRKFILQAVDNYNTGDDALLRCIVSEQLLRWSLVFKNECFKHEEEVRLIVDVGVQKLNSQKGIPQIETLYRMSNGFHIPYIKLQFEKHCLSYVRVGPLTCDAASKTTQTAVIEERLSVNGYSAIVNHSNIPVRY